MLILRPNIFEDGSEIDRYIMDVYNVVPRLSSLRSSLEQDTLVNAGHVAPRFWEPLIWLLLQCFTTDGKCNTSYIHPNNVRIAPS